MGVGSTVQKTDRRGLRGGGSLLRGVGLDRRTRGENLSRVTRRARTREDEERDLRGRGAQFPFSRRMRSSCENVTVFVGRIYKKHKTTSLMT